MGIGVGVSVAGSTGAYDSVASRNCVGSVVAVPVAVGCTVGTEAAGLVFVGKVDTSALRETSPMLPMMPCVAGGVPGVVAVDGGEICGSCSSIVAREAIVGVDDGVVLGTISAAAIGVPLGIPGGTGVTGGVCVKVFITLGSNAITCPFSAWVCATCACCSNSADSTIAKGSANTAATVLL